MEFVSFLPIIGSLIFSIIIHEVAHGYMANWLGDPTARLAGRLTLNPIPHIDPLGSVILPAFLYLSGAGFLFGWANPVPYNPYNLRNQRWGEALIAVAGPAVNIILALVFAGVIRIAVEVEASSLFIDIASYIVYINLLLAFFNLLPFPPLDGSKILASVLPYRLGYQYRSFMAWFENMGIFGMFLFIFLVMFVLWAPLSAFIQYLFSILTGVSF